MNRSLLSNLATAAMVACALVVTTLAVRRELFAPAAAGQPDMRPRRVDDWEALLQGGQWMGRRDAPVRIVEFSDFQCPFCAKTHPVLEAVLRRHPDRVAVLYRHFPLDAIHPHARPAAVAAECAGGQGRFEPFATLLFAQQDSLGTKAWSRFAREAGVPDAAAFERCLADARTMASVDRDAKSGADTQVQVTPTLIINGTLHPGALSEEELEKLIANPESR
ncbi:DsbA family protein [Longimicrobium sp.]|uniref:DsbA family protein n=1 Tax=Longimicrobium sp. TaxID=2029185 RepID=UPI002CE700E6|nr:DsbA family protein [Longimicrobium sp.]HSU13987.1 DsbA family protein [Longimicrobium sp.]